MAIVNINLDPSEKDLRWFPVVMLVFFGLIGAIAYFQFESPRVGGGLWCFGALFAAVYWLVAPFRRPLYGAWMRLVAPVGSVVSYVILGVVFYCILTPMGVLLRVAGRDVMERKFDFEKPSYWCEHRTGGDKASYFKQY